MEHKHLIVRTEVLNPPTDNLFIEKWLTDLVSYLGMKVAAGPISSYITKEGNRGLTAAILIETSHVVIHVWDEVKPSLIQLDIYTCSHLDVEKTIGLLEIFRPIKVDYKILDRNMNIEVTCEGRQGNGSGIARQVDSNRVQQVRI